MRGNRNARNLGPSRQLGNGSLHRTERKRFSAALAQEYIVLVASRLATLEIQLQSAPGMGIEGDVALLAALAVPYPYHPGSSVHGQIADPQRSHFPHPQPGLEQ